MGARAQAPQDHWAPTTRDRSRQRGEPAARGAVTGRLLRLAAFVTVGPVRVDRSRPRVLLEPLQLPPPLAQVSQNSRRSVGDIAGQPITGVAIPWLDHDVELLRLLQ